MDAARGKTLADFSPEQINRMVWSARLWLRNQPQTEYAEQVLLTQDARAEITRRAISRLSRGGGNMNLCGECGRVNGHHPHCPNAEDIPHNFSQCEVCGEIEESGFINDYGACIDCEELRP
jgi:hypothetical protein